MHPRRLSKPTTVRPAVALSVLGACLTLAACGSSASSSTNTTSTSASASSKRAQAPGSSRFTALKSCLAKQGITLPAPSGNRPPAGTGSTGGGGPLGRGGGFQLPKGVSRTQFQEALKKCGGGNPAGGTRFNGAASKTALTKFVACMRENGVNLPAPNTSGNGPVFNTKQVNTTSSTFKSATAKCQSDLRGAAAGGSSSSSGGGGGSGSGSENTPGKECSTTLREVLPPVNTRPDRSETELLAKKHIAVL